MSAPVRSYGVRPSKATPAAVAQAADALFHSGTAPTVRNVRERLGGGALSAITPLLRAWWIELPRRLDREVNTRERRDEVAHLLEALWLQAIEEAKIRARSVAASEVAPCLRDRPMSGAASRVAPLSDASRAIVRLEQDLSEFKRLWSQECNSRRMAERRADQLRAELLRLVRLTIATSTSRRSTSANSPTRVTPQHTQAPSLAKPNRHKATPRKRKATRK